MLIGVVHYVTFSYNEVKFSLLLENHLTKKLKGSPLNEELFQECLAAFLECQDSKIVSTDLFNMESYLNAYDIKFLDCRAYSEKDSIGNPNIAIKAFNMLFSDFLLKQKNS